jgi:fructose-1,6-bisphosphatase/inositol monophosphatase family enzyme
VFLGNRRKPILAVDTYAEFTCQQILYTYFPQIKVYGEEKLRDKNLDLHNIQELIALLDMVDGTDLLKRGLFNWCSAAIFFNSQQGILGAYIGVPSEGVYYALKDKGAYKQPSGRGQPVKLNGISRIQELRNASICFYGQAIENFLSVARKKKFINHLQKISLNVKKEDLNTRIYNLGGNPMMVKLAEGHIDAVFDLMGQYPHDVAPGAFIAKEAGAVFKDLKGNDIDLLPALLKPAKSKIKYILASTPKLFEEIRSAIR